MDSHLLSAKAKFREIRDVKGVLRGYFEMCLAAVTVFVVCH